MVRGLEWRSCNFPGSLPKEGHLTRLCSPWYYLSQVWGYNSTAWVLLYQLPLGSSSGSAYNSAHQAAYDPAPVAHYRALRQHACRSTGVLFDRRQSHTLRILSPSPQTPTETGFLAPLLSPQGEWAAEGIFSPVRHLSTAEMVRSVFEASELCL